ncbi:RNA methyltransferase-domain-containing protein [Chytridium lagenaria]|nr:RNA methyltransferase-domain-containing protein [Chytridium lagenaria]
MLVRANVSHDEVVDGASTTRRQSKHLNPRVRRRAFVEGQVLFGGKWMPLSVSETHHLVNVLRLTEGDAVWVTGTSSDSDDYWVKGILQRGPTRNAEHASLPLVLEVGMVKMSRFEWIVEKAVEVGAMRIGKVPSRWKDRAEVIAMQALKQCGRTRGLEIGEPVEVGELGSGREGEEMVCRLVALEPGRWGSSHGASVGEELKTSIEVGKRWPPSILSVLNERVRLDTMQYEPQSKRKIISLCVGPEGGWSDREVRHLLSKSDEGGGGGIGENDGAAAVVRELDEGDRPRCVGVSLSNTLLRTETACIAGMGTIAAYLTHL